MHSNSIASLTYLVLPLVGLSFGRPVSNPLDVCDSNSKYSGIFSCCNLRDPQTGDVRSTQRALSQEDLRILDSFSEPCPWQGQRFSSSLVEKSSSRILDVEVPLPTTYLMSLSQEETSEDSIETGDPSQELYQSPIEPSVIDTERDEVQYLLCLQKAHGISVVHPGVYWDQDRSMNAIIGIVVLFLVIVLVAEMADMMLEQSVLFNLDSPFNLL
jgi:hypothetical protein